MVLRIILYVAFAFAFAFVFAFVGFILPPGLMIAGTILSILTDGSEHAAVAGFMAAVYIGLPMGLVCSVVGAIAGLIFGAVMVALLWFEN